MKFRFKGIEFDTDKYVYVLCHYHKDTYHGGEWCHAINYDMYRTTPGIKSYPIKCKRGVIKNIEVDFNHGQSFVTNFEVEVKNYHGKINIKNNFIAHTTKQARELYDEALKGGKIK